MNPRLAQTIAEVSRPSSWRSPGRVAKTMRRAARDAIVGCRASARRGGARRSRPVAPARSRTRRGASARPLRAAAAAAPRARGAAGAAWRSASVSACSQSADRKCCAASRMRSTKALEAARCPTVRRIVEQVGQAIVAQRWRVGRSGGRVPLPRAAGAGAARPRPGRRDARRCPASAPRCRSGAPTRAASRRSGPWPGKRP